MTNPKPQHTPQWDIDKKSGGRIEIKIPENKCSIALTSSPENIALAVRIVKCVNLHDELIKSLQGVLKSIDHIERVAGFDIDQETLINELCCDVEAMINRAKGQE